MKLIAKKKSKTIYRHTLFYSPVCFVLCRPCNIFFCKLKITGNPASNKSISSICATAFVSFLSLCHILVISTLFQSFFYYYIRYTDLWSVIFDIFIVIIVGPHKPSSYMLANLINECVPTALSIYSFPTCPPSLGPTCPLRYKNIEIMSFNNPWITSKCSRKGRVIYLSLIFKSNV